MANFEPVGHTPNFDILWQQWLARQANSVTLDGAQEISNKIFNLSLNTLTGTLAEFNAALSDGDFVTLAGAETLTGPKTLTSPIINTGDINTPDIDGGTIDGTTIGGTTSAAGTFSSMTATTVNIDGGTIDSTVIGGTTPAAITGSSITVSNTADAAFILTDTNAGTNVKSWRWHNNNTQLSLQGLTDALAVNATVMTFTRSAAAPTAVTIGIGNTSVPDGINLTADTLSIEASDAIRINQAGAGSVDDIDIDALRITIAGNNSFTINGDEVLTDGDPELAALAGLTSAADRLPYFTGSGTAALATFTAGGRALVNSAGTADTFPYFSASNTVTLASITAAGLALLDDAAASNQRTTLGLGTIATQDATNVNIDGGTIDGVTLGGTIAGTPTMTGLWTWTTTAAGTALITVSCTDASASSGPLVNLLRDSASPAANDNLGILRWRGKDDGGGTDTYTQMGSSIISASAGAESGAFNLQTMVAGALGIRVTVANGMFMAGATGGDQGAGTINATAVYDDGVLLTDYIPDAYLDGDYSVTDYDNRIPVRTREDGTIERRQHGPARRFKTNFDELDPVLFANKWKAARKLPAFNRGPERKSTGECIQALLETVEVLAVHLDKHETRLQALE